MAGSLIKIDEEIVTSAVASVSLLGINSTYDVYMVALTNVIPSTDGGNLQMRFTESGTPNTSLNYDHAFKFLTSNVAFSNTSQTNQNKFDLSGSIGNATGRSLSQIQYIYNANNSSEYSFFTLEQTYFFQGGSNHGMQGGGVFTVSSEADGVYYFMDTGNIASGKFSLFGLKK